MLTERRLKTLLAAFSDLRIGVVGDFFLDAYYDCNPALDEKSLETGKTCYQVVRTRRQAGAAGTVAANLKALGVGHVDAVGFCGDDGEGYELRRAMGALGLDLTHFFCRSDRSTPTYGKPCYVDAARRNLPVTEELERLDIKNRRPTPAALQEEIIACACDNVDRWDGVVLLDQVGEANCGVLTGRVRRALLDQLRQRPDKIALADSRERIHLFKYTMIKPNQFEAVQVLGGGRRKPSLKASMHHARALVKKTHRPVFVTLGAQGMLVADNHQVHRAPGFPIAGPVDPVGAGDSTSAAIVAAMAAGADQMEAAHIANLAGSITTRQIGTTGTASPAQIRRRHREVSRGL